MAFTLAPLPYAYDALEPAIDARTMEIHHGKHHQNYVNNLNAAIADTPYDGQTLEALFAQASTLPPAVRNNAGGHWNHDFFWNIMTGNATPLKPGALADDINATFGSLEAMQQQFSTAGATRLGSGWAWLTVSAEGKLQISSTLNQDNPLFDNAEVKGTPILTIDVWEHAYYLNYQNRRPDFIQAWWSLVNWEKVEALYAAAKA